jgi:hypothetical protein
VEQAVQLAPGEDRRERMPDRRAAIGQRHRNERQKGPLVSGGNEGRTPHGDEQGGGSDG